MTSARAVRAVALTFAGLVVAVPFFAATTFLGDDHVFLAFARHAPNPFLPFVVDQHGGEYYRPLPMLVWWLLGRAGEGAAAPFAVLALGLHATAALLVAALLGALRRPRAVALTAAALMFIAPQNLQAAYWFSASTDLFATVFVLSSLVALLRRRVLASATFALAAYLCKESALVLPGIALVVLGAVGEPWRRRLVLVAPHIALVTVVLVVRTLVLHGTGSSGDPRTNGLGHALQIAAGFFGIFTGEAIRSEVLTFGVGAAVIALVALAAYRRPVARTAPFLFAAAAALPLGAAGWAVGARYFYLPSVGVVWAVAEALASIGPAAQVTIAAAVLLVGAVQAAERRQETVSYDRRVAAARRAVGEGITAGHRIFHVDGGIKDLDLAVKEASAGAGASNDLLVLNDVPASFAIVPPALASAASIVVASPPIPPSGAYRFGDVRVVGLARRGDEPSLDEVVARFPDIRFIRLRPTPTGRVIARDLTDEIKRRLDGAETDGQN